MIYSIKKIQKDIIPILKQHQVKRAGLFGSIVNNTFHENSDIDVLVELPRDHSLLDRARLKVHLEDHFGRKVDVINYHSIKAHARTAILASQVPIYP
jgi:predicted nucleotidyltransferase